MTAPTGRGRKLARCSVCSTAVVAMAGVSYCFRCWPGGPVAPPPCLRCGSHEDYFATGLCIFCHPWGDPGPGSCQDCLAWGTRRANQWICHECSVWRAKQARRASPGHVGPCRGCGRTLTLGSQGACRLCLQQAVHAQQPPGPLDLVEGSKNGQQLFLAVVRSLKAGSQAPRAPANPAGTAATQRPPNSPSWLSGNVQSTLFAMSPDLAGHGRAGLHERAHPDDAARLETVARDLAQAYHWTWGQRSDISTGARIMVGIRDDPLTLVRASEVQALRTIDLPVSWVLKVLAAAGALDDDRTPHIDAWFAGRVTDLPAPMAEELHTWFDVMKNGTTIPPRRRPRSPLTIELQLRWALPTLQTWAAGGHTSLRQISRDDVLNALPTGQPHRARVGQGLKSVFRVLKSRKVLFVDPTARLATGEHESRVPMPLDVELVATRLHSENPATALIVALLAFHGLRLQQLQRLLLVDITDNRLTIDGRVIPLAYPVRRRLSRYLDHRGRRWPESLNPHLLINSDSWRVDSPVGVRWIRLMIGPGLTARQLREDRILNEFHATGGDVRSLADLFGLSIQASTRYMSTLENPELTSAPPTQDPQ
jgi:hypothetical protein